MAFDETILCFQVGLNITLFVIHLIRFLGWYINMPPVFCSSVSSLISEQHPRGFNAHVQGHFPRNARYAFALIIQMEISHQAPPSG
jgi:hypothetical protein